MIDINYFRAIQNGIGVNSAAEAKARDAKEQLKRELTTSVNYVYNSTRNGALQPMVITSSDVMYKCDIEAFPDDELYPGDMVDAIGEKWVVVQTKRTNPFQILGIGWCCNYEFKFQNGASPIKTCWGVMDSGVYSTTKAGDATIQSDDKQFKIYLPLNDDTKYLYVDKRLAIGTKYNEKGEEIIDVYQITGRNVVARSYGRGAHLLILEIRSAEYSASTDSMEYMVCDYVTPESEPVPPVVESPYCVVTGRNKIYAGASRTYTAKFYTAAGVEVAGVETVWDTPTIEGVSYTRSGNKLKVSVADADSLVGQTITIGAADTLGGFAEGQLTTEVIAVG